VYVTLTAARNSDADDLWKDHLLYPGFRVLRGIWLGVSATASRDYTEAATVTRNSSM